MARLGTAPAAIFAALAFATSAQAALVVSRDPTSNVQCTLGTCAATGPNAVLNVSELEGMLAGSPVTVKTGSDASDIVFDASLKWSASSALTLDAYRSIVIGKTLDDKGTGALTLVTDDGGVRGTLSFDRAGHITVARTATPLVINGKTYLLSKSIAQLAANIAASPKGFHALVNDYDASADGSYSRVPIPTEFAGRFEGLGNTISNLAFFGSVDQEVGLFAVLQKTGTLRDIRLTNVNLWSLQNFYQMLGGLVGYSEGHVIQCSVTGKIRSDFRVTAGGLIGQNYGDVDNSFADVEVDGAQTAAVGGLIGNSHGTVENVYATGRVIAGDDSDVGGLIGYFIGDRLSFAYSTGQVSGGQGARVGGLLGADQVQFSNGKVTKTYWDTDQSGVDHGTGATNSPGVTGRTTAELRAGLPHGFAPAIWGERGGYNNGLPYLLAIRP